MKLFQKDLMKGDRSDKDLSKEMDSYYKLVDNPLDKYLSFLKDSHSQQFSAKDKFKKEDNLCNSLRIWLAQYLSEFSLRKIRQSHNIFLSSAKLRNYILNETTATQERGKLYQKGIKEIKEIIISLEELNEFWMNFESIAFHKTNNFDINDAGFLNGLIKNFGKQIREKITYFKEELSIIEKLYDCSTSAIEELESSKKIQWSGYDYELIALFDLLREANLVSEKTYQFIASISEQVFLDKDGVNFRSADLRTSKSGYYNKDKKNIVNKLWVRLEDAVGRIEESTQR